MSERFADRTDAGRRLADALAPYARLPDVVVLGLPRGGVPVAYEVAQRLGAPLEVFLVRKLGVPGHEELALGAVASGGARVLNQEVLSAARLSDAAVEEVTRRELATLERQEEAYRDGREPRDLRGTTAILVDDGLATGATMRAAVQALRSQGAARIVVAVPVAPRQTCEALAAEVDEVVCPCRPDPFTAVGLWYRDFKPVSDERVRALLEG
ncbi:MAG: phosphoribosyltransferase [Solirubrobacteraceae bacterium]